MVKPPRFADVLAATIASDFGTEWMRLNGIRLPTSGIEAAIDKATGYDKRIAASFVVDVYETVYRSLPGVDLHAYCNDPTLGIVRHCRVWLAEKEKQHDAP